MPTIEHVQGRPVEKQIRDELINAETVGARVDELIARNPEGVRHSKSDQGVTVDGKEYAYQEEIVTVNGLPVAKRRQYEPVGMFTSKDKRIIATVTLFGLFKGRNLTFEVTQFADGQQTFDQTNILHHGAQPQTFNGRITWDAGLKEGLRNTLGLVKPTSQ